MRLSSRLLLLALFATAAYLLTAQTNSSIPSYSEFFTDDTDSVATDTLPAWLYTGRDFSVIHPYETREAVYDHYEILEPMRLGDPLPSDSLFPSEAFNWLDDAVFNQRLMTRARQRYMVEHQEDVRYNVAFLPEPPKKYHVEVDPESARLVFIEETALVNTSQAIVGESQLEIEKRYWLHSYSGKVQLSQSYLSSNWYQGGNSSLSLLVNLDFGVKLNTVYHPNLLCEFNASYKFNATGTPEDSLRNYNINLDQLQLTGKVGVKAWKDWFYSLTGSFKTQLFKHYDINNPTLKSSFLSPAELNLGLGVTWAKTTPRMTTSASIAPLSYNLKTCTNSHLNPVDFGIDEGHKTKSSFGSSANVSMSYKLTSNITYSTKLAFFTDYDYAQADWENTLDFTINKFLSASIYAYLRYDSSAPSDSDWHHLQLKEIISLGFAYSFSTI